MNDDEVRQRRRRDLQNRIREVAYLLWETSGRDHGRTLEFWLAAEHEVMSEVADSEQDMPNPGAEPAAKPESPENKLAKRAPGDDSEPGQ